MGFTTTYCGKKLHNLEIKLSSYFHINLYTHYNGQKCLRDSLHTSISHSQL